MGSMGRNDRPGVLKPRSTVECGGEGLGAAECAQAARSTKCRSVNIKKPATHAVSDAGLPTPFMMEPTPFRRQPITILEPFFMIESTSRVHSQTNEPGTTLTCSSHSDTREDLTLTQPGCSQVWALQCFPPTSAPFLHIIPSFADR